MTWINVGIAAVGVVSSLVGSAAASGAASDARALGRANAKYIGEETEEQKRRLEFEQERTLAKTRLGFAASGFRSGKKSMGGSQRAYMSTLKGVQESEMDWLTKSGESRAAIAKRGGQMAGATLDSQATGQLFGAASSAMQGYADWSTKNA